MPAATRLERRQPRTLRLKAMSGCGILPPLIQRRRVSLEHCRAAQRSGRNKILSSVGLLMMLFLFYELRGSVGTHAALLAINQDGV